MNHCFAMHTEKKNETVLLSPQLIFQDYDMLRVM